MGWNGVCSFDCAAVQAAARTWNCRTDGGLRALLCEILPLNCAKEAKVGSDKLALPHSVNFIPGQRKALEGLNLHNFAVYLRF